MDEIIKSAFADFGKITVGMVITAWFLKSWLEARIKADVEHGYNEKLKKLEADNNEKIETLKSELSVMASDRTFRFSHIFEKTADTIAMAYSKLDDVLTGLVKLVAVGGLLDGNEETFSKAESNAITVLNDFTKYFRVNRLYIPKETANKISTSIEGLAAFIQQFRVIVTSANLATKESLSLAVEHIDNSTKELNNIRAVLASLEDDFRNIYGISQVESTKTS